MSACATLGTPGNPSAAHEAQQLQRIAEASAELENLAEVDMRIRLDNTMLGAEIERSLRGALDTLPAWRVEQLSVSFFPGYVAFDTELSSRAGTSLDRTLELAGDVRLSYTSGRVSWLPEFHSVIDADGGSREALVAGEDAAMLTAINWDLFDALRAQDEAFIEIDPMPLGILETGIRLQAPFEGVRADSSVLEGVVTTAGAVALVDPETSSFALDLGFVPGLPDCEPTVSVGRVTFAAGVRNREPVDPALVQATPADSQVFFTDIVGARAATTVVHYWFADGQPASLSELNVQPSARWRTWSSRPADHGDARLWQVLVVEKPTGCILAQRSVVVQPGKSAPSGLADLAVTPDANALRSAFAAKTAHLADPEAFEGVAAIDVATAFYASALSEAMYDLHLSSRPEVRTKNALPIESRVDALPGDALSCEQRDCAARRVCTLDFDDCPIRRDNRDCSSCLIRNPLNNRCMREAEDPICIAARDGENLRLEERRQACIVGKTRQRDACVTARERDLASCQERASREVSACASQAEAMAARRSDLQPIGRLAGEAWLAGDIEFDFSAFRIEEDLRRMRMEMTVNADLVAEGRMAFLPANGLGPLASCLEARGGEFRAPLALPLWEGGLATGLTIDGASLRADWSGLVQELAAEPPLVYRFLEDHPDFLSSCAVDVDTTWFDGLLSGTGSELLQGALALDMQPEPTRITLLPAYLKTLQGTWTGTPAIGTEVISYRLAEPSPAVAGR